MNRTWTAVLLFVVVVSLVLLCGLGLLALLFLPGRMGMMGGTLGTWRCPFCGTTMPFGSRSLAGLLALGVVALIGLGLVALLIVGIVWLVRRGEGHGPPAPPPPQEPAQGDVPAAGRRRRRT